MFTEDLPQAAEALHPDWPAARFNVSGMFTHHPLVFQVLDLMREAFNCRLPIEALHGAPAVLWNAGRPVKVAFNLAAATAAIEQLHARNIGCFATFSNHLLERPDLDNRACNQLLDVLAQRPDLNGVIISSDLLSEYISKKYPSLPQVASIIKVTLENGEGRPDYYHRLGERFHRYVVHPDDCRRPEILQQLDRGKAEIILNENCAVHCPNRTRHYQVYAEWQKAYNAEPGPIALNGLNPAIERQFLENEMAQLAARCPSPMDVACLRKGKRNCNLTRCEFKAIYEMGFRHFKIQGRYDHPLFFAYDLFRYLLEPEVVGPMAFKTAIRFIGDA